ncbi:lysM domain receptor-like kinase 4 [Telopea speciosissima]|uniref:lysM domain receptor-like kinase 4 n=1 Tax=Telopea speciosissima TaxID=54955 RepID=UPI001CC76813|nr:lysM domain receptor-like kinase 4 [Telopea speciosissima]
MGVLQSLILLCIISLISSSSVTLAQQPYVGLFTSDCQNTNSSTSVLGYFCNVVNPTCQSYLIYRSQPSYDTVSSIAYLFGSDQSQLAQINSVSENEIFGTNKEVIVPVNCSCSGQFSQANTTYSVQLHDTPFLIANDTLQGLSTCQAIQNQNINLTATNLNVGQTITIPLRCACPSKNQSDAGIKYLLSYTIGQDDSLSAISGQFQANSMDILAANELSDPKNIYPTTTLLVPLRYPPSSSQTSSPPPPPSSTPPPPSPSPSQSTSSNKIWLYVVIAVAASVGTMVIVFLIIFSLWFRKPKRGEADPKLISKKTTKDYSILTSGTLNKSSEVESSEFLAGIADIASIKEYKFADLQSATENFTPNCWINGSVYRGKINGDLAAIKKINGDVSKEINLLSKINHVNIIKLSGVCFNEGNWYFVYEYAMNGPLSNWIRSNMSRPKVLSWTERVQIALDVAKGLNYLHSYTNPPYVHKDIKSSNILLDSDFRAMIANFGLARSTEEQEGGFALTKHIVGTKGYMAPEYLEDGLISPKLDVYAFGVVMLELITGKDVVSSQAEDLLLLDVLIAILHEENTEEKLGGFIDPSLQAKYPLDLALSLARLIESCLSKNPASRPGMDKIAQSLSIIVATSVSWESLLLGTEV